MLGLFYEMTLEKINLEYGVPTGIRTPVTAVKGRCPSCHISWQHLL